MRALVSIHDVMPETLESVQALVATLRESGHRGVTLLVVPGRAWRAKQLAQLRDWASEGVELAAHGWGHRVQRVRGTRHRLHAALISRNVAEHLALDEDGIVELMHASAAWFPRHDLPSPSTYVPPAWALGGIRPERLRELPYHRLEVLRGHLDTASGKLDWLPLVGFEADTPTRPMFLRAWNRLQFGCAQSLDRPVRVAIHPNDPRLRLRRELDEVLERKTTPTP